MTPEETNSALQLAAARIKQQQEYDASPQGRLQLATDDADQLHRAERAEQNAQSKVAMAGRQATPQDPFAPVENTGVDPRLPSRSDFGAGSAFYNSVPGGLIDSLSGQLWRASKYFVADSLSNSEDAISKEMFQTNYAVPGGPQWRPGMSVTRAQLMVEDYIDDARRAELISGGHDGWVFGGGLLGQVADPLNYVGGAFESASIRLAKAGFANTAKAFEIMHVLAAPSPFATESRLVNAGQRAAGRFGNALASGTTQGVQQAYGLMAVSQYTQNHYSSSELAQDALGAFVITAGFGLIHSSFSHVNRSTKDLISDQVLDGAVNGDLTIARTKATMATDPVLQEQMARQEQRLATVDDGQFMSIDQLHQVYTESVLRGEQRAIPELDVLLYARELEAKAVGEASGLFMSRESSSAQSRVLFANSEAQKLRKGLIEKKSRAAFTNDEKWMADLYKRAFGVDVKYFDEHTSQQAGALGFFAGSDAHTIHVRSGALMGGVDSMMSIAGHEVSHSISKRMPKVWLAMADAIVDSGVNPLTRDSYVRTAKALDGKGPNSLWSALPVGGKMDEVFATVSGQAMQTPEFWRSMYKNSPSSATALKAEIVTRADAFKSQPSAKGHWAEVLTEKLGKILATADEIQAETIINPVFPIPGTFIKGGYALYGSRHLDFLARLHESVVLGKNPILMTGPEGARRPMSLAELDAHIATMVSVGERDDAVQGISLMDRSGSQAKAGSYDIRPMKMRLDLGIDLKSEQGRLKVANFILNVVFAKADPKSEFGRIYKSWAANETPGKWWRGLDTLKGMEQGDAVLKVFDNKDGTISIGVHVNDKAVQLQFDRATEKQISKGLQDAVTADLDNAVRTAQDSLNKALWGMRRGQEPSAMGDELLNEFFNSDAAQDVGKEWRRLAGEIGPHNDRPGIAVRSPKDNVFDAFLAAFHEFVSAKREQALLHQNYELYKTMGDRVREVDILQHHRGELPENVRESLESRASALQEAWVEYTKESGQRQNDPKLSHVPDSDPDAFKKQVAKTRAEFEKEMMDGLVDRVKAMPDGDKLTKAEIMAGFAPFVREEIAAAADLKLREIYPGLERSQKLAKSLDDRMTSFDRISEDVSGFKEKVTDDNAEFYDPDSSSIPEDDGSFMARLADETPEQAAARALERAAGEEQRSVLKISDLEKLGIEALKREHGAYDKWNRDYTNTAQSEIATMLEDNGIEGFTFTKTTAELREHFAKPEMKLNDGQRALVEQLIEIHGTSEANTVNLIKKAARPTSSGSAYTNEILARNLRRNDGDTALALTDSLADVQRQALSEMNSLVRDTNTGLTLRALVRKGPEFLKSFLDGLAYKGVPGWADSVATSRLIGREQAQARFINLLEKLNQDIPGFREQWMSNAFTKNIELHQRGMYSGPDHVKAAFDQILERLKTVNEALVGEANLLGANIRLHKNYLWGHVHRAQKIRTAGQAQFVKDITAIIDEGEMQKLHGPGFDPKVWAEQFYYEVTDMTKQVANDYDPDLAGNNLADTRGLHRAIVFQPGKAAEYDLKYGSGNTAALIVAQLGARGEKIGMMRKLGTNYNRTWGTFIGELGGPGPKASDLWVADLTFRHLAGQLDHPYNNTLAVNGRAVRNWMNSAVGWLSGISSMTDYGNLASQARFMGGPDAVSHGQLLDAMAKHASKDGKYAAWARGQGAGLQSLVQSYARNMDSNGWFAVSAQTMSNLTFKYNGMELMNRSTQGALVDVLTQIAGEQAKAKTLSPEWKHWLDIHNITEPEFRAMAKHAAEIDGLDGVRLSHDMIPDLDLSRKFHAAQRASMDYALMQPSASTEAILRMGTQAGTWSGEAVRTVMQFKSYPVDMVRRITRRFNNGYSRNSLADRMAWGATMIGLATAAISIKDMTRGTEPLNPFDSDQWTLGNATRIMGQAAVGPFATLEQFMGKSVLGPTGESVVDLATAKDAYGAATAVKNVTPFNTVPGVTAAWRTIMSQALPETFGRPVQAAYAFREQETGQSNIFQHSRQ